MSITGDRLPFLVSIAGERLRGVAALADALDLIGKEGGSDRDMAKIICDNELALRALVSFALHQLTLSLDWEGGSE